MSDKKHLIQEVNTLLGIIASHYMESFQGDVVYSQYEIIETLLNEKRVELYIGRNHFDSEVRFRIGRTNEDARKQARIKNWGDYCVTLSINDEYRLNILIHQWAHGKLVKAFPIERVREDVYEAVVSTLVELVNTEFLRAKGNFHPLENGWIIKLPMVVNDYDTIFLDKHDTIYPYIDDSVKSTPILGEELLLVKSRFEEVEED